MATKGSEVIVVLVVASNEYDRAADCREWAEFGCQHCLHLRLRVNEEPGEAGLLRVALDPPARGLVELGGIRKAAQVAGDQGTVQLGPVRHLPAPKEVEHQPKATVHIGKEVQLHGLCCATIHQGYVPKQIAKRVTTASKLNANDPEVAGHCASCGTGVDKKVVAFGRKTPIG